MCNHEHIRATVDRSKGGSTFPLKLTFQAWCEDCGQQIVFPKKRRDSADETIKTFTISGRAGDGAPMPEFEDSPPKVTEKEPQGTNEPLWEREDVKAWCADYAGQMMDNWPSAEFDTNVPIPEYDVVNVMLFAIRQAVEVGNAPWESYKALLRA